MYHIDICADLWTVSSIYHEYISNIYLSGIDRDVGSTSLNAGHRNERNFRQALLPGHSTIPQQYALRRLLTSLNIAK